MNEYMEVAAIELNDRKVYIVSDEYDKTIGMYYDSPFYYTGEFDFIKDATKLLCNVLDVKNTQLVENILRSIYIGLGSYKHYGWRVDKLEVRENDNKTLNIKIYNNGNKKIKPSVREFIYSGSYSIEMITDQIELVTENDNV